MQVLETNGHLLWVDLERVVWMDASARTVRLAGFDGVLTLTPDSFGELWDRKAAGGRR